MNLKPCSKCGISIWIPKGSGRKKCFVCLSKTKTRVKKDKTDYSNMFHKKY